MHELFGCLNAKPNDPHEQENHSVEFFSGISLETLQPCPLDGFDLLFDDAKSLHLTLKRCDRIGWQRNSLGCSHRLEFLRRFAQDRVEGAHTKLHQYNIHRIHRAGPLFDRNYTLTMRLTAQPAKKATL